ANFNPLTANITYMPSNAKHSYVMSWFFSVQREVAHNTLIDLAYVGNRANRLLTFANFNEALPNKPGQNLTLAQRQNTRPFPNYGDITYAWNGAFSDTRACRPVSSTVFPEVFSSCTRSPGRSPSIMRPAHWRTRTETSLDPRVSITLARTKRRRRTINHLPTPPAWSTSFLSER